MPLRTALQRVEMAFLKVAHVVLTLSKLSKKMAENKIVLYCVACEPALGNYRNARAFFKGIAETTSGRYLSLGNAHLLPEVIVGGSAEELDLKKIEDEVTKEYAAVTSAAPTMSSEETIEKVWSNVVSRGVNTWQLDVTHQPEQIANADIFMKSPCLSDVRSRAEIATPAPYASSISAPSPMHPASSFVHPTSYATQAATYSNAPVSREQISKVLHRNVNNSNT